MERRDPADDLSRESILRDAGLFDAQNQLTEKGQRLMPGVDFHNDDLTLLVGALITQTNQQLVDTTNISDRAALALTGGDVKHAEELTGLLAPICSSHMNERLKKSGTLFSHEHSPGRRKRSGFSFEI